MSENATPEPMTLTEFFTTLYAPYNLRGRSEHSYRLYELTIMQFERTLGRPATLEDITDANILTHLRRRHEVAPATRNKELTQINAIWRFAVRQGLKTGWPNIRDEPEPDRTPVAWTHSEIVHILKCAARCEGVFRHSPRNVFWVALIRLLLDTGERIGAVKQAKWSWMSEDWINFPAGSRKGRTRDRPYRLGPETIDALKRLKKELPKGAKEIFSWPYHPSYLYLAWHKFLRDDCKLPSRGGKHGFHKFRKTVASVIDSEGADAQRALDHHDWVTTQQYLDPRFKRSQQSSDIMGKWLKSGGKVKNGKKVNGDTKRNTSRRRRSD